MQGHHHEFKGTDHPKMKHCEEKKVKMITELKFLDELFL